MRFENMPDNRGSDRKSDKSPAWAANSEDAPAVIVSEDTMLAANPYDPVIREALREIVRPATIAELIVLFACLIALALWRSSCS